MILRKEILICIFISNGLAGFSQGICNNENFESTSPGVYSSSNSVSGWLLSSQTVTSCISPTVWTPGSQEFAIVATPVFGVPLIGTLPHSPLGGGKVAVINTQTANSVATRLSKSITVTNANTLFSYAFAGYWQIGNHNCCEQASFMALFRDSTGTLIMPGCVTQSFQASCVPNFSVSNGTMWVPWQVRYIDLTPFIGTTVSFEFIAADCIYGDHYGVTYLDATCSQQFLGPGLTFGNNFTVNPVSYCAGSNIAGICGPLGYASYSWTSPPGSPSISPGDASLTCITVTNPVAYSVYSLNLVTQSGCIFIMTATLTPTQVSVAGIGSSSTCFGGNSGSATVAATGSGSGYIYAWYNSTNSVVGTNSVAVNLSPGIYTVVVTASNAPGCGTAVATTTVGSLAPGIVNHYLKPYCDGKAYFHIPGGYNYQWFAGSTLNPVPVNLGGNSGDFTVTTAQPNSVYILTYTNGQGCSAINSYTLISTAPGTLSVSYNKLICQNDSNGMAILSLTPSIGAVPGSNYFVVSSSGSLTPAYLSSVNPTALYNYTVSNLHSGGNYSVVAFDGECSYSVTFTPNTLPPPQFSLSVQNVTLCPGNAIASSVIFGEPPAFNQYTYQWTPNIFIAGNNNLSQNTIISPTAAPGTVNTIIYTVEVTPTAANCPVAKTLTISSANPVTPAIQPVPPLCSSSPPYSITVFPPGGVFQSTGNVVGAISGVINPFIANAGINYFVYANSIHTCQAVATGTYMINTVSLTAGPAATLCNGTSHTLSASGATTYSWSNGQSGSVTSVMPAVSTVYSVTGTGSNGCSATKTVIIQVLQMPVLSVSGTSFVCYGDYATLSASGASSYTWSYTGGVSLSGNQLIVSPPGNTTFTLSGATDPPLCISQITTALEVRELPVVSMYGDLLMCQGQTGYLYAMGADTYTWSWASKSVPGGTIIAINPVSSIGYTVTGTDQNSGCKNFAAGTVTVTVCSGLESNLSEDNFMVFPNPASDVAEVVSGKPFSLFLYNITGQLVFSAVCLSNTYSLRVSDYQQGLYLLKLVTPGREKVLRLVITEKNN